MADTKISDLSAAASVADADVVPLVQGGATKKGTFSTFWTYVLSKINATGLAASVINAGQIARARGGTGLDLGTLAGQAGKVLSVKAAEDGLELVTPTGGTNGQLQYNAAGAFAGHSGMTYDPAAPSGGKATFANIDVSGDISAINAVRAAYVSADLELWTDGQLHAGGNSTLGSMGSDNTHNIRGTVEILPGNTVPGTLGVTDTLFVDGHIEANKGGSAVASTGLVRAANGTELLVARNSTNTADIAAVSVTSSNVIWIGNQASGSGSQPSQAYLHGASSAAIAAGGSARVTAAPTLITMALPVVGANTLYGAINGIGTQAMADANQTPASSVYRNVGIECTGALTATRDLTLPTPSTVDGVTRWLVHNRCTGGAVRVKTATGTATVTIAIGMSAWVEVRNDTTGVARGSSDVAHGLP